MRFYTGQHQHNCGVDLHARTMYLCILSRDGEILLHRNTRANPTPFSRPSHRTAWTWSSASSACSLGTGSPTCVAATFQTHNTCLVQSPTANPRYTKSGRRQTVRTVRSGNYQAAHSASP